MNFIMQSDLELQIVKKPQQPMAKFTMPTKDK